ncbi:MAG: HAMP domain-containing protein [Chloroflexi bacterium]|nr:HAMP domain-containing protein [Chloroflexota bacterium]
MRANSIQGKMSLLFLAFFLLITVSVGATFWSTFTQKTDARIINIAGRQRMLTQQMIWLALNQPDHPELEISIQNFNQNLNALHYGGLALDAENQQVNLPPAPDPELNEQLAEVSLTWNSFQNSLENLRSFLPSDSGQVEIELALQTKSSIILDQLDSVVIAFEKRAEAKILRLQFIQASFLFTAILALAWGFIIVRKQIVTPLAMLAFAAKRMGEGNLAARIQSVRNDELGELAQTFESMRVEVAASRNLLEARVVQRTHELEAAIEISQEIAAQLDLDHLLSSVMQRTRDLMQSQAAALCLFTPDGKYLELAASNGKPPLHNGTKQSIKRGLAVDINGPGQTVQTKIENSSCAFLNSDEPGLCTATPLRIGNQSIGAMCVVRSEKETTRSLTPLNADEERALTLLANAAAIAINNARLVEAERQQAEKTATLSERNRLAEELHDNLAQTLSFLNLKAERVEELLATVHTNEAVHEINQMKTSIRTAQVQVRTALTGLIETPPSPGDFAQKIAACVGDFNESLGLKVELSIPDLSALTLPRETRKQILHIIREALTNVRLHSKAKHAWVQVDSVNGLALFAIKDDGCGFDPSADIKENHLGLSIMRTRAERSGGSITIESSPGGGTKIAASFPLAKQLSSKEPPPVIIPEKVFNG